MRIAHLSDPHLARRPGWGELNLKRLLGFANQALIRGRRHSEARAAEAVRRLAASPPDLAILTGDIAQHGLASEFAAAEEMLAPLAAAGVPVLAVGGNHDFYGGAPPADLARLGRRLSLGLRAGSDGVVRLPGVEILLLEQAAPSWPFFSGGSQKLEELTRAAAAWAGPPEGVMRLAAGHYPVIDAPGLPPFFRSRLAGAEKLADFFRRTGVSGYFCGHRHLSRVTDLPGGCRQFMAPALPSAGSAGVTIYECGSDLSHPIPQPP
ncbi:MAG: metallophosphoesterase [Planctomycetota bacterium]|jgi:3',5'-cyclic AMP phosphodiesterase CpdA|nr:metallophosphoesterase [Planctomycetota bacterium]